MLGTSHVAGVVVDGAVLDGIWSSILRRGRLAQIIYVAVVRILLLESNTASQHFQDVICSASQFHSTCVSCIRMQS